jgi:NTE family protein
VFRREDITADVVMASAALPHVFRAVEIDGEPYWDGGFTGNPAILPLVASNADDVLLVQIAPLRRSDTPTSARDILNRVNEISFSSSLAAELRALEYVGRGPGRQESGRQESGRHAPGINVHRILLEGLDKHLNNSRLKTDFDFFRLLHRAGRRAARRFLDRHFSDIGHRSTLDLVKETAA